jgi:phenylpropionate dioxygenase-like ring-hydroxylating dioxygenase large terminal subunit
VIRGEDGGCGLNVCRHRALQVAFGPGTAAALRCPYHGWTYGLDGRLMGVPQRSGFPGSTRTRMVSGLGCDTTAVPFVTLNPEPEPPEL